MESVELIESALDRKHDLLISILIKIPYKIKKDVYFNKYIMLLQCKTLTEL